MGGVPPRLLLGGVADCGGDGEEPKNVMLPDAAQGDLGTTGDLEPAWALDLLLSAAVSSFSIGSLDSGRKLLNTSLILMSSFAEQSTTFTLKVRVYNPSLK